MPKHRGALAWGADHRRPPCEDVIGDLEDLRECIVEIIVLTYIKSEELWGVGRLFNKLSAEQIAAGDLDSSPSVVFSPEDVSAVVISDAETLIVEGVPQTIDHLACVMGGVWTRPSGDNTNRMSKEHIDA